MDRRFSLLAGAIAGCMAPGVRQELGRLQASLDSTASRQAPANVETTGSGPGSVTVDAVLAGPLDLATALRWALARSPELAAAREQVQATLEGAGSAAALDDPELKLETERVPLRHPGSLNRAEDNMVGLMQRLPFPGKLRLRAEVALRGAEAGHELLRAMERQVVARTKRAYQQYSLLVQQLAIHASHAAILADVASVTEVKYRTGKGAQQDFLKAQIELVNLRDEIIAFEQRLGSTRAELNLLLNRRPDAALGPPLTSPSNAPVYSFDDLAERALAARPEVQAARAEHGATEAAAALAHRDALFPDFTVSWDYWHVPGDDDGYGASLAVSLPWITGRRASESRRAKRTARAADLRVAAVVNQTLFEVRDALLRVEASRRSVDLLGGELLARSRQGVEVSRAAYENDTASFLDLLEAERALRDVEIRYQQNVAAYESALADLELSVGVSLKEAP